MREIRTLRIEEAGAGDVTMEEMRTQTTIERVVMVTLFLKLTRQFSTLLCVEISSALRASR